MDFKLVGWQDIVLKIPQDWEMVFATKPLKKKGKKETSYFGFRTSKKKMMELRWIEVGRREIPDLDTIINDYFKTMRKQDKKIKKRTEKKLSVNGHFAKTLYWITEKATLHGYIVAWYCEELNRIIILQSQFSRDESNKVKDIINRILENTDCHPVDYKSWWVGPNLNILCPRSMKLEKQLFLVGLSFFQLRHPNFNLLCYRLGLANQKIDNFEEFPNWFINYYPKKLPNIPSEFKPETKEFNKMSFGKEKKEVWKYEKIRAQKRIKIIRSSNFQAFFWENKDKNDIYVLIFKYKAKTVETIDSITENIVKLAISNN